MVSGAVSRLRGQASARLREWRFNRLAAGKLLRAFADTYPDAFFIEIGANDGREHSALREFVTSRRWTGIMVEPLPRAFEQLRRNYAGFDRVSVENAAISDRDGRLPFFHLDETEAHPRARGSDWRDSPQWLHALGSLSREQVLSHAPLISDIEERIVRTEVPCLTFKSLCLKHDVEQIDLLVIDTEGYDYEIVRQIDFDAYRPRLLIYEHLHLSALERDACRARLLEAGYELMEEFFDTLCLDPRPADSLTRRWRRLRPALAPVYAG
jgi:FkbM family methyltransferase